MVENLENIMKSQTCDYKKLTQAIVKELRGEKSQQYLNKKFDFNSNQFSKWESGALSIKWIDFVKLCSIIKKDLKFIMSESFAYSGVLTDEKKILETLISGRNSNDAAKVLGVSADQVRRWRRNSKGIKVPIVLEMIDKLQPGLFGIFISNFLPEPMLCNDYSKGVEEHKERESAYLNPTLSLIPYGLELDAYKKLKAHDDELLAKKLGISVMEVKEGIALLEEMNIIKLKNSIYQNSRTGHLDLTPDLSGFRRLMQFHANRVSLRLENKEEQKIGLAGFFNVFNLSEEGLQEVNNLNREYYVKMTELIEKHQGTGSKVITALSAVLEAEVPVA